jgi:cold shock CspA family protein
VPDDGGADVFVHARDLVKADTLKRDQRSLLKSSSIPVTTSRALIG